MLLEHLLTPAQAYKIHTIVQSGVKFIDTAIYFFLIFYSFHIFFFVIAVYFFVHFFSFLRSLYGGLFFAAH